MTREIGRDVAFSPQMGRDVAFAGQRVRQKICMALTVSAVIPLLILVYAIYVHVLPLLDPVRHAGDIVRIQALLVFTALLIAAGVFIIWDLAMAVSQAASLVSAARGVDPGGAARTDEVGTLVHSFGRMLATVEHQAGEINQFARRLEDAYAELEVANARLKDFSFKDEVTGLYNRRFFGIRLEEEISRYRRFNHPVSVVLIDVDDLKLVNDELGHAAGDEALRTVADVLVRHSRGINVICRYGGDEFAVLLVETAKSGAEVYAERLREVLGAHVTAHGRRLTASLGVASLPDDVGPSADIVRAADQALYAAKRAGKNRVALYPDGATLDPTEARTA
jgi:diguanylate cyclase (GGDEF)-like protein